LIDLLSTVTKIQVFPTFSGSETIMWRSGKARRREEEIVNNSIRKNQEIILHVHVCVYMYVYVCAQVYVYTSTVIQEIFIIKIFPAAAKNDEN